MYNSTRFEVYSFYLAIVDASHSWPTCLIGNRRNIRVQRIARWHWACHRHPDFPRRGRLGRRGGQQGCGGWSAPTTSIFYSGIRQIDLWLGCLTAKDLGLDRLLGGVGHQLGGHDDLLVGAAWPIRAQFHRHAKGLARGLEGDKVGCLIVAGAAVLCGVGPLLLTDLLPGGWGPDIRI